MFNIMLKGIRLVEVINVLLKLFQSEGQIRQGFFVQHFVFHWATFNFWYDQSVWTPLVFILAGATRN